MPKKPKLEYYKGQKSGAQRKLPGKKMEQIVTLTSEMIQRCARCHIK